MATAPVSPPPRWNRRHPLASIGVRMDVKQALERLKLPGETWDQFLDRVVLIPHAVDAGVERPLPRFPWRHMKDSP